LVRNCGSGRLVLSLRLGFLGCRGGFGPTYALVRSCCIGGFPCSTVLARHTTIKPTYSFLVIALPVVVSVVHYVFHGDRVRVSHHLARVSSDAQPSVSLREGSHASVLLALCPCEGCSVSVVVWVPSASRWQSSVWCESHGARSLARHAPVSSLVSSVFHASGLFFSHVRPVVVSHVVSCSHALAHGAHVSVHGPLTSTEK